ncbi:MAG: phenylalanine--tRNA ligase subunit alpha [Mariprofundaceae bacterium]|nr:phenylalanine--tRNA ligase subunit alpha [Mariprofundaceae bacterium]
MSSFDIDLESKLHELQQAALEAFSTAANLAALDTLRVQFLGKRGQLTALLKGVGQLSAEQRPLFGKKVNTVKAVLATCLEQTQVLLHQKEEEAAIQAQRVDVTLEGRSQYVGQMHPLQIGLDEISGIFASMGFEIAHGPEIEDEFHNFDALNIPPEHPARAMHDTFFVKSDEKRVLRTHTSPVQIRSMLAGEPPLAIVAPGRVYRCDYDVTHSPMFHQVEVFLVDKDVNMAQLKGVLSQFLSIFFGKKVPLRMRPSYFPFTEPSAEVDIGCVFCDGKGCRVCKDTGWLEVLGSGMIHPNVLRSADIDPEVYSGFAFGLGVERMVMLKYGIPDLRLFFENDVRFLQEVGR